MTGSTVAIVVCALYLLATLVMGILPAFRVSRSVTGFVAADRSMNAILLYFVLGASIFSSFAFLGGPGWAYSRGAAAYFIVAYGILGMVPFYFIGPRARRLGARFGHVTQAELLTHRFGSRWLSLLLAIVSVAAFVPYLTLQMKGAGYILSTITEGRVSAAVGAAVTYSVVLVYVLASGVLGVGWTNLFQGMFMMIIAWTLGLMLPSQLHGGIGPMFEKIAASSQSLLLSPPGLDSSGQAWSWAAYSSAVTVSAIGFSMWPHLFMKSYAAKSDQALRLTVVMYPTFQLFLIPILLIGFAGILAFPDVQPADTILPHILANIEGLSPLVVGLVCAGTLAASMSSGDSILHAAGSITVRDGLARGLGMTWDDDRRERQVIRLALILITLVAFYFAVFSEVSIVALLLAAYGGIAQIFPLVFAAFYWPRATGKGALAGLASGILVSCYFLARPQDAPIPGLHEGVYGLIVNIVVFALISWTSKPDPEAVVRQFVACENPE